MKSAIKYSFDKEKVLLPVIHYYDDVEFWRNIDIAYKHADGVWLITQGKGISERKLCDLAEQIRAKYPPTFFIGVNFLRENYYTLNLVSRMGPVFDGLWTDNAHINEVDSLQLDADNFRHKIEVGSWRGLYFGGVAFKYQRPVYNLDLVTECACEHMHVVTTSGPGTGKSAKLMKIKQMREVIDCSGSPALTIGQYPDTSYKAGFALASGVTINNVRRYLPYVDAFMVGTGIEKEFGILDEDKVKKLAKVIYGYQKG